jgi:hypothetical protein
MEMRTVDKENLSAADRIIQTVLAHQDHMVHNRPGFVVKDPTNVVGVRWAPVTHKVENGQKVVYQLNKVGKKTVRVKLGVLQENGQIKNEAGAIVGEYRNAGLFPEVATWLYTQVAEVWKLDNEFAARWASYAFTQEHRDLKVVLAAFMLVQSRKGDPVIVDGKAEFYDEDYRDVGEAMMLIYKRDGKDLNPKLLIRIRDLLSLPGVAAVNREMGFGKSARRSFLGRWDKAVGKWLHYREENPKLLDGLVKQGFRTSVMSLSRFVGFKPETPRYFETLHWKQTQAEDGRRTMAIGKDWAATETWEGQTEEAICQRIMGTKPGWKVIVGRVPKSIGITRAIMAAAIEAGSLSPKDLIIALPTIEELGLLNVQEVREKVERAVKSAEDMRAANIATRLKTKAAKDLAAEAADNAMKKAVEEVIRGLVVYVIVDISGSMENAIEAAKRHIAKFVQGFPLDKLHVAVFNTTGREIKIPHASAAGVENAFRGILAGGGTHYGAGVRALSKYKPDPGEDAVFIFVGDEEQSGNFVADIQRSGITPVGFGLLKVGNKPYCSIVRDTAAQLGIPCFQIDERTFDDPYAVPRTIRNLLAATPVGQAAPGRVAAPRITLVDTILGTPLLVKPSWAA